MVTSPGGRRGERRLPAALSAGLGAALVAGWLLHDIALVMSSSEPYLAFRLLPASLLLVALGLAGGILLGLSRWVWVGFLVLAGLGVAGGAVLPGASAEVWVWPTRVLLLLLIGWAAARWLVSNRAFGLVPTALTVGAGLAALTLILRTGAGPLPWVVLACSVIALIGQLGSKSVRFATIALAAAGMFSYAWAVGVERSALPRPDRAPTRAVADEQHPNLVLVVLDTVRADRLPSYGYFRPTMPGLEAWADAQAKRYLEARSTSSWTLPAHASLLTGLLPSQHHATHPRRTESTETVRDVAYWPAQRLPAEVTTLTERLEGIGFRTGAIVANAAYLSHEFGLDRGFEHYDARGGAQLRERVTLVQMLGAQIELGRLTYRDARAITDRAIEWLSAAREDQPYFLFVNYMDAHIPNLPPRSLRGTFEDREPEDPLRPGQDFASLLYDRELLFLDRHLTRLLEALGGRRDYESTVVVVTSDHGEAFGEHGLWLHDRVLYEEMIRVPLFVKPRTGRSRATVEEPIGGAEVFDLMLRELGLEPPARPVSDGMIAEWFRSAALTTSSAAAGLDIDRDLATWIDGSLKFIVSSRGEVEIYDLEVDPGELRNLAGEGELTAQAVAKAENWWRANPPLAPEPGRELDSATLERLKALGYLD